jgi:apolipoprotein N-acyltransferase
MKTLESLAGPAGWNKSLLRLALAVVCFHIAYAFIKIPTASLFIFGYAYFLVQLADQTTVRRAFYFGLTTGFACAAGQAFFFWKIFSAAAIVLWLVFGFWIGLFTAICCGCIRRWGKAKAVWLIPFIWTGTEYFRSELYYLRFSWLNVGYVFSNWPNITFFHLDGMYGMGFVIFVCAIIFSHRKFIKKREISFFTVAAVITVIIIWFGPRMTPPAIISNGVGLLKIVGVQLEFPPEKIIPEVLDQALRKNPDAPLFVLSEYTLDGPVPDSLKNWCREHSRFLVVGGKDVVTNQVYYDTAFVVGTNGQIIFKQAKCVPIQLFKDGLPATNQAVWNSPWGKIGFCICYDLSYTRVTDELVRQGAQLLIVPSMDVEEWGKHEHILHSRVAPVRASEYHIPIFRVASSGISQAVLSDGKAVASTGIPARGEIFSARLHLPARGALPFDRYFAPFCVAVTGAVTATLLFLTWKDKRSNQKQTAPQKIQSILTAES